MEERESPLIEIVDYQTRWPSYYRTIAAIIREAVGDGVEAIHHIGSTAVPGLAAKDVIDVQLTVADLSALSEAPICEAGFTLGASVADHCPPGASLPPDQLAKRYYTYEKRAAHIHVREVGRLNQRYPLLCRDYLRAHPPARDAYEEIKRQLASYFLRDKAAYYAVKDPTFDLLMVGAEDWARISNWSVPPSDE